MEEPADCCISGGGPAGVMLGYLLARAGLRVTVLEKHADFFRDFRGDTIHPSTLALLGELGLLEKFLAIPHNETATLDAVVSGTRLHPADFRRLPPPGDVLVFMPQWDFLDFLTEEASAYPGFRLLRSTEAVGLLREDGTVTGVRARTPDGQTELRATLTVAADGRSSTLRDAAGLVPVEFGVPIDVLWFRVPRPGTVVSPTLAYVDGNGMVITIDRGDYFQVGMVIPKGGFEAIRGRGLPEFRRALAGTAPPLASSVEAIADWDAVKLLSVQINRLERWHAPGLLVIGDAAHAMSPAFGVGVNYAIQDAVAAANVLTGPLRARTVTERHTAEVERQRMPAIVAMQRIQLRAHQRIARPDAALPPRLRVGQRMLLRAATPFIQRYTARMIGRGFHPTRWIPQPDPTAAAAAER